MSNNNGTRKTSTIRVNHACHDLGVSEEQFRPWLQPFYKNWEKIPRIKYEYYEIIVESINDRIKELEEQKQETEVQRNVESQQQETEVQQEIEVPTESQDDEGTTSSLIVVDDPEEEIEISPQEAKEQLRIQMQTVSHLPEQALKLKRITGIAAVAFSQENLKDFEQIYTHRMNNGMNKIISNQTAKTMKAIDELQRDDNAEFLGGVGKRQSLTLQDLDKGEQMLLKKANLNLPK